MLELESLFKETVFGETAFGTFTIPLVFLLLHMVFVLAVSRLVIFLLDKVIDKSMTPKESRLLPNYEPKRLETLKGLLKNAVRFTVYFIAFIILLGMFGIDTTSIVASAGVLGLAVSFGAQGLVKDVITGFFVIMENYYAVGEYVQIGSFAGYVEELGLRSTKIRDSGGELHIFPNGTVSQVTNYSRGKVKGMVDIAAAADADVACTLDVLRRVSQELQQDFAPYLSNVPEVLGITSFGIGKMVVQIIFFSSLEHKGMLERELRKRCKAALEQNNLQAG